MCHVLYRDDGTPLGCVLRPTAAKPPTPTRPRAHWGAWARAGPTTRPGARSSVWSALRRVHARPTGRPGSVVLVASVAEEVLLRRSAACCASTAARSRTPTTTTGTLRRLGACLTDDAAGAL
jgi:hypothetical protein